MEKNWIRRYSCNLQVSRGQSLLPPTSCPLAQIMMQLVCTILAHPELFQDYEIVKGKMDDVFLAVTGRKLAGGEEG